MKLEKKIENYINGIDYSKNDLEKFVLDCVNEKIDDELMTKFLKSIFKKPLSPIATSWLTDIMMHSGEVINLQDIPGIKVDKHSTGGVGDKVTLIVAPIVASLGAFIAKMSGRGLGFTGGTLDKLESIPGYNIFLTDKQFKENLKNYHIAIIGQTKNLVPADKKIYALRDETNLIASVPLIASSIMSKKLATGADAILLDVKCGDAAFMKTKEEAITLAKAMIAIGKHFKKDVRAEITSMDTPLGYEIGNKNEVLETINFLSNKKNAKDLQEVIYSSASTMLVQAKIFANEKEAIKAIKNVIKNGKAFDKFKEWIMSQGGNLNKVFASDFWKPKHKFEVKEKKDGFFNITSAMDFGIIAMKLGAGRKRKEDKIDYDAGISLAFKTGDKIRNGNTLFTLFSSKPIQMEHINYLKKSYQITKKSVKKEVILEKIQ